MAKLRDRPYAQFNFVVECAAAGSNGPRAVFEECSGIRKITGLNKSMQTLSKWVAQ
jgi:hypothetical protein